MPFLFERTVAKHPKSPRASGEESLHELQTIATRHVVDKDQVSQAALKPRNDNQGEPPVAEGPADPFEALWLAELAQARNFLKVIVALVLSIFALVPFLLGQGHPGALRLFLLGSGAGLIASIYLLWDFRKPDNYTLGKLIVGGMFMLTCAWTGVLYFGVYSPAPAIFVVGVYFFSISSGISVTGLVYGSSALLQLATVLIFEANILSDPGAINGDHMTVGSRLSLQFLVQFLFLVAFMMGRLRRKNTMMAIQKLEDAAQLLSGREALLDEAKQELDVALQVGSKGRYTGQTVGSFILGALLGRGGMGEVYAGKHTETGEPAAIKLLGAHAASSPDFLRRFMREAEAASSIDTPFVVRVLEANHTESGIPYLAMERLVGQDLAQILRDRTCLTPEEVCKLVEEIGAGIEAARVAGIVHRDLKPQNLFLARQPNGESIWKILDFGVSKLQRRGNTLTEGVVGTPAYMSPEQARGQEVDYRSDLYSLATVAYRALTGRPAFLGTDIPSTMYDVVYAMPIRPTHLVNLPSDIDSALLVGMAKEPSDRYATGRDFGESLRLAGSSQINARSRQHAERLFEKHPWKDSSQPALGLNKVLFK